MDEDNKNNLKFQNSEIENNNKKNNELANKIEIKIVSDLSKYNKLKLKNHFVVIGTAIANSLLDSQDNDVILWGISKEEINDINKNRRNSKYFNKKKLNKEIKATKSIEEALVNVDAIIFAIPSEAIKNVIKEQIIPNLTHKVIWISVSKGFDFIRLRTITEMIADEVPINLNGGIVKISGPTFAIDVINKKPSSLVAASKTNLAIEFVEKAFSKVKWMKIEPSNDIYGVELSSIIKNAMALGLGIIKGLGYEENTTSRFLIDSLFEIKKLAKSLEIDPETIYSYACLGDLILTGLSNKSRNHSLGYEIGKEDGFLKKTNPNSQTFEGLRSIQLLLLLLLLLLLASSRNITMPIVESLYRITYENKQPSVVIKELLYNK